MQIDAKGQKAMLWLFLVLSQVYTMGYVLTPYWPPVPANLNAAEVVALYNENHLQFQIGSILMIISGAFLLPYAVVVEAQMARCEQGYPIWAKLQLAAAILGTWVFAFPPVVWAITAFSSPERDPVITLMLHEAGWIFFLVPVSYFAMQIVTIGIISFFKGNDENSPFPRWMGYLSIWTGITGSAGFMSAIFKTGPFAWDGAISFWMPLVIFMIWIFALFIMLFIAVKKQEKAQLASKR